MSFTLKFLNKEVICEKPTKLSNLVKNEEKKYVCALVNNRVWDLNHEVSTDAEIEFLDLTNSDAVKIYETSLRYLFAMAFKLTYPKLNIRYSYNVSRTIYIQILNKEVRADNTMINTLNKVVKELVERNIPFNRMLVSKEEAKKIYEKVDEADKLAVLDFRPEDKVHFYECDGYMNYMYGLMVPSTGYLKDYRIRLYSPGIVIQYPRAEEKGQIPAFEDAPTFGKTLKESHVWAKITGSDSVCGINQHILKDGIVEFINICETRHNRMLSELGDEILRDIDSIRLICIAGPSSSGKTTFSNRLKVELLSRGIKPVRLSIDDYYMPKDQAPKDENGDPDLESIYALDVELFNQNMIALINGEEVELPKYDFKQGKRVKGKLFKVADNQPIIIEGIHALNEELTKYIPKHQKYKIYIAPQAQINLDNHNPISITDLRLLRRMVRDFKYRNSSAEETMSMWPSVRRGEFKWIYDTQEGANYVFNSMLSYELCVMKKYATPLLSHFEKTNQYFPVAERLIRLLKYFIDMPDEWVPCNSLIREFIGGSCYHDAD